MDDQHDNPEQHNLKRISDFPEYRSVKDTYLWDTINMSVTSVRNGYHRVVKPKIDSDGYLYYHLPNKDGSRCHIRRGRLQLITSGSPCPGQDHTADHINGIPSDDRLENLRWLPRKNNKPHGRKPNRLNKIWAAIAQYERQFKNSLMSAARIAKASGVTKRTVYDAGRKETHADVSPLPVPKGNKVLIINQNTGEFRCSESVPNPNEERIRRLFSEKLKGKKHDTRKK